MVEGMLPAGSRLRQAERSLLTAVKDERNKMLTDGDVRSMFLIHPVAPEVVSAEHVEQPWCRQAA